MCGRYQLDVNLDQGEALLEAILEFDLTPRYNAAPMQSLPVVRQEAHGRAVRRLRWGLVPHWAPDQSFASKMINARSETVRDKPAFRDAFRSGRCLIPSTGFYEWKAMGRAREPYLVRMPHQPVFAMAGLWSPWSDGQAHLETFTVLTTDPRGALGDLHHRMPVILDRNHWARWLNPESEPGEMLALLEPRSAEELEIFAVSDRVNRVSNDDPGCAAPAPAQQRLI